MSSDPSSGRRLLVLAVVSAAIAACAAGNSPAAPTETSSSTSGGAAGAGGANATQALEIVPADAEVVLPDGAPATVAYVARLVGPGDVNEDVTADATFTLADPELGGFEGATLTATKPGKTNVIASARGMEGETGLNIQVATIILGEGVSDDAPTKFGGAEDATKTSSFVYPPDGTLVPPNMNVLELHFVPAQGDSLFELTFSAEALLVKVYITCSPLGNGCVYAPDETVWKLVAEAGRGTAPVSYVLRGVNAASPGTVSVSEPRTIAFGLEDIIGGLYYWATAGAATATMRYEFGASGQSAELYMDTPTAGGLFCLGCHVMSRDGTRVAVGLDMPAPAPYKVYDVATKSLYYAAPGPESGAGANFFAFSPDASQIMTSTGVSIGLRDAATGATIVDPLVPSGAMPDWSPDGNSMVFAKPSVPITVMPGSPGVDAASLEVLHYDGTSWGSPTTLVPFTGQNNYYPAYSPEGGWVLFNRASGNSYDAPTAQVWVVPSAGGTPIHLAKASTGGDSWPKWTPDVQNYRGGSLMWLTFSSRRAYGLRLVQGQQAQIWMTAFDPAQAALGKDGSYPAFWLPFQDLGSGNHIAQWVTKVERKPCLDTSECAGGEICTNGICKPDVPK